MCWPTNGHCVRLESRVLFKTEYLAIFIFPVLLQCLLLVPVVCMLFQQLYKNCVWNKNPVLFTHIFTPLCDFVNVNSCQVMALQRLETETLRLAITKLPVSLYSLSVYMGKTDKRQISNNCLPPFQAMLPCSLSTPSHGEELHSMVEGTR